MVVVKLLNAHQDFHQDRQFVNFGIFRCYSHIDMTFEGADDQNEMDAHFGDGNWTHRQLFLKVTNIARNAFKDLEFENILNLGYCYHKHDI